MRAFSFWLVIVWLVAQCAANAYTHDEWAYRRTPKEKIKQVLLYPWRYTKLVLIDDFGIKESIWMAAEYDHIDFH